MDKYEDVNDGQVEDVGNGKYKISFTVKKETLFNPTDYGRQFAEPLEKEAFYKIVNKLADQYYKDNYQSLVNMIDMNAIVKNVSVKLAKDLHTDLS